MATALKLSFLDAILARMGGSEAVGAEPRRCPFARFFKAKAPAKQPDGKDNAAQPQQRVAGHPHGQPGQRLGQARV